MSIAYIDLDEALVSPLLSDSGLLALLGENPTRLFASIAPRGDVFPYAVFSITNASVLNRTPKPELDVVYLIETYAESREGAQSAQAVIHQAVMNADFAYAGYACYAVKWLGGRCNAGFENGRTIWRMSGEYRLRWVG